MGRHQYNIEIAGNCNLRCPSCPVGNSSAAARPRGFMDVAMFEEIARKIVAETKGVRTKVALYDWGEPMLHPQLPEILGILHKHGLQSRVSSNLNIDLRLEPTIKANPHEFHISLSGFYERNYSLTHRRGRIEKVTANMRHIRELIDRYGARTRVVVGFHVYRHNIREDLPAMRDLAMELGFEIEPVVAQFFPIEKNVSYLERLEGKSATLPQVKITRADEAVIDLLLVRPEETYERWRSLPGIKRWWLSRDCGRIARKTSVRIDGTLALCCVTYDADLKVDGHFLDTSHRQIQERRRAHPFCATCIAYGLHVDVPGSPIRKLAKEAKDLGPQGQRSFELLEIEGEREKGHGGTAVLSDTETQEP